MIHSQSIKLPKKMAAKPPKFVRIFAIVVISFLVLVFMMGKKSSSSSNKQTIEESIAITQKSLKIGDIGVITETIPLGVTKEAHEQVVKAATANDVEGVQQMMQAGLAVSVRKGTHARYLEPGAWKKRVRLTDGKYKGIAVYVPSEYFEAE